VEEEKLLRTLILSAALGAAALPVFAQEALPREFAPGAQGEIGPSVGKMVEDAERLGAAWAERLQIQEPDDFGITADFDALRKRALDNPRVRALLGADGGEGGAEAHEDRYGDDSVFLLASFSMPVESLRAVMVEAMALEVPIIMRGFVNNSAFETQAALQSVFGDDADAVGFGIDPTIFARFGVESVPQLIVTKEPLEVCEMQGCVGETPPVFDVVKGNIPIRAALEMIVQGRGDAAEAAGVALARAAL
jgi:conjugal transfer pilus assembly protein TrbC